MTKEKRKRRRMNEERKLKNKGKKMEIGRDGKKKLKGESKRKVKETRQLELEGLIERNKMGNIRG